MRNERGLISFQAIVTIALVILGVYLAFKFIPPWIDYFALKDTMEQIIKMRTMLTEGEIKERVIEEARQLHIPLSEEDIVLEKEGNRVILAVNYEVRVLLPWGLERVFSFSPEVHNP